MDPKLEQDDPQSVLKKKFCLTLVIPTDVVGLLIGKQGATLREISAESGAKMAFQAFSDMPPGTKERCVVIWGSVESILKAEALILAKMEIRRPRSDGDEVVIDNGKYLLKWLIPNYMCGLLIGRHGDGIKLINETSGAWVKVAHEQETAPGAAERMIYITGTKEQNAAALKLVVLKVGGRHFTGEPPEEPLDPMLEECLYIPSAAVSTVLATGPHDSPLQSLLDLHAVSLRTSACSTETGLTNVRLILKGPEAGRSAMRTHFLDLLSIWRSAGAHEKIGGIVDGESILNSYEPGKTPYDSETSIKMTMPSNMIKPVFGEGDNITKDLIFESQASIRITPHPSPSMQINLVVVVLGGLTRNILKAQELLLVRMLFSKLPMTRLPVQLSNNINAAGGGISSNTIQSGNLQSTANPHGTLRAGEADELKQIELQLQALQVKRNNVLSGGASKVVLGAPPLPPGVYSGAAQVPVSHPIGYTSPYVAAHPYGAIQHHHVVPSTHVNNLQMPVYVPPSTNVYPGSVHHHIPQMIYAQTPMGLQAMIYPGPQQAQHVGIAAAPQLLYVPQGGGPIPMMYAMVQVGPDGVMQPIVAGAPTVPHPSSAPPPPPKPPPPPPTPPPLSKKPVKQPYNFPFKKSEVRSEKNSSASPLIVEAYSSQTAQRIHDSYISNIQGGDKSHRGRTGNSVSEQTEKVVRNAKTSTLNASASVYTRPTQDDMDSNFRFHSVPRGSRYLVMSPSHSPLGRSPHNSPTYVTQSVDEYSYFAERNIIALTDSPDGGYSSSILSQRGTGSFVYSPTLSSSALMSNKSFSPTLMGDQSQWGFPSADLEERKKVASLSRNISRGLKGFKS